MGKIDLVDLSELANDHELLEVGRIAIEDELVEWRDSGLMSPMRGNGLAIRNRDGSDSPIIRFGPEYGLKIALEAISNHLSEQP